jgi:nucleoside-diphosphate kinase
MIERTLVVLKPDTVKRALIGEIISRFERAGLKIVGLKMFIPHEELANKHYPTTREEFIVGMGQKTLDNYEKLGMDPVEELGSSDAKQIGLMVQGWLVNFLTSGPVVAMVLEAPHAIELTRKIVGGTLPIAAEPGTIRGDYSFDSSAIANKKRRPIKNLIHASGEPAEAEYEINLWFDKDELVEYKRVDEEYLHE